jgi:hypothetical protein
MGWIASLVLGLPGMAGKLFDYLGKRSDNTVLINGQNVSGDSTVAAANLTAYVEERKVIAAERAARALSPWTAWMIPTAFALCMLHFGSIVFVSTFPGAVAGWTVFALPSPYDKMEWSIVMAVIGVAGIAPTLRRIFAK